MAPPGWNAFFAGDFNLALTEMSSSPAPTPSLFARALLMVHGAEGAETLLSAKYDLDGDYSYLRDLIIRPTPYPTLKPVTPDQAVALAAYHLANGKPGLAGSIVASISPESALEAPYLYCLACAALSNPELAAGHFSALQDAAFDDVITTVARAHVALAAGHEAPVADLVEWLHRYPNGQVLLGLALAGVATAGAGAKEAAALIERADKDESTPEVVRNAITACLACAQPEHLSSLCARGAEMPEVKELAVAVAAVSNSAMAALLMV